MNTTLDGTPAIQATTVLDGSDLWTGPGGASQLITLTGDQLTLGAETRVKVELQREKVRLRLRSGRIAVRGFTTEVRCLSLRIFAPGGTEAVWQVAIGEQNTAEIVVVKGPVHVQAPEHTIVLSSGQRITLQYDSKEGWKKLLGLPGRAGAASALVLPLAVVDSGKEPVSPSGL